ncbi:MAG: DUF5131 family protein, partial [Rectinemataceae bacterium]|nr:DUF5131 family protein [Rectinemataceae bacterium]
EFIHEIWSVMRRTPQHTYQILTKRAERMKEVIELISKKEALGSAMGFYSHVWLGVSVEDQKTADERIPLLLRTPAAVRWISAEPILGPIDLQTYVWPQCISTKEEHDREHDSGLWCDEVSLDWVVAGGESGPGARPMDIGWARDIRDQCKDADVPMFMKQLGSNPIMEPGPITWPCEDPKGGNIDEFPQDLKVREFPRGRRIAARPDGIWDGD